MGPNNYLKIQNKIKSQPDSEVQNVGVRKGGNQRREADLPNNIACPLN
jgi:hypothetical protein